MTNVTPLRPEVERQKKLIESFNEAVKNVDRLEIIRMRKMNEQAKYRHMTVITDMVVEDIVCNEKHKEAFQNAVGNAFLRLLEHVEKLDAEDVVGHQQMREAIKPMIVRDLTNTAVDRKLLPEMFRQPA